MVSEQTRKWDGKTGVSSWGQRSLVFIFRHCSVYVGYAILALVVPFYMLFSRKGYRSIYSYFRKRQGYSSLRAFLSTYRNHFLFGQVILDRFAIFSGRTDYQVDIENDKQVADWFKGDKGFILLSSHVGNFEICGYLLKQETKCIYALIYGGEGEMINQRRQRVMEQNHVSLIKVSDDFSHVFVIGSALQHHDVVSMPADRLLGSTKSVTCPFLNGMAEFPLGPFTLAARFNVPILTAFAMKTGAKKYKVMTSMMNDGTAEETEETKPREEQLARQFAARLEEVMKAYPLQWFNFYEFWNS
jgi:predicted LPLAT superfamily acyltransferase